MAGLSVQFVGINEVIKAFENFECVNWAVCQGKNINFSYSGNSAEDSRAELVEWLQMLSRRVDDSEGERYTTQAIYTLKFYDDLKGKKINASMSEYAAFNFRLSDGVEKRLPARSSYSNEVILDELRGLRSEIKEVRELATDPARISGAEEDKLETWEKILDHPLTVGLIGKVLGIDVSGLTAVDGARIAGVVDGNTIESIIDNLYKVDPKIKEHLAKLLLIAETNPGQFNMLLGMLEKM